MKALVRICFAVLAVCVVAGNLSAVRLLNEDEALNAVFGSGCTYVRESKVLSDDQLARVKDALGGRLYHEGRGGLSSFSLVEKADFIFAVKDGRRVGVALRDVQPGKWGPVEFMTALTMDGKVSRVVVMSYEEKRGAGIARASYLSQYKGKTAEDRLEVGKDITGITGATVSAETATFAVKKALAMYQTCYKR